MSGNIKKVVIVGADADAWISALFLITEFSRASLDIEVELIETETTLSEHDCFAVLPSHRALHSVLGANEANLCASAKATRFYAQRFSGWCKPDEEFFLAFDKAGDKVSGADFYQCYQRALKSGLTVPLAEFSPGIVGAKHGKRLSNPQDPLLAEPSYGYHLHAISYVTAIAKAALQKGVIHKAARVKTILTAYNTISSLVLNDGSEVCADLFIDATGQKAMLINRLAKDDFQDFSPCFPCDRLIVGSASKLAPTPGFSQISAFAEGWYSLYPLQNRTAVRIHYASAYANKDEVIKKVSEHNGLQLSCPQEHKRGVGLREHPWVGNCVAVGDAAAALDDLDALHLQPLVLSLTLLREYFPLDTGAELEAKIFNHKFQSLMEGLLLFQQSHYLLNQRFAEPLWDASRNAGIPEILQHKIDLFKSRGIISLLEAEIFDQDSWIYLFHGYGLRPEHYDPLVDSIPEALLIEKFKEFLNSIGNSVASSQALN